MLLARTLHDPAEVLVFDEPTSALDLLTEQHVAQGLRNIGRTILIITSSPLLLNACHRVIDLTAVQHGAEPETEGAR